LIFIRLGVYVNYDRTIYIDDLLPVVTEPESPSSSQDGSPAGARAETDTWATTAMVPVASKSGDGDLKDFTYRAADYPQWKKSLLLLLPMTLTNDNTEIHPHQLAQVEKYMELRWSLGIMGGVENGAQYYVGKQADRLILMDPHINQETVGTVMG